MEQITRTRGRCDPAHARPLRAPGAAPVITPWGCPCAAQDMRPAAAGGPFGRRASARRPVPSTEATPGKGPRATAEERHQATAEERHQAAAEEGHRFDADVAHALRTSVAAIRAELEEARLHPGETDPGDLAARALAGVDRLEAIIGDLAALDGPRHGEPAAPEPTDLLTLAGEQAARRAGVRVSGTVGILVDAVRPRLAQVVGILLDLAARHDGAVRVEASRDGDTARLTVGGGPDPRGPFRRFARLDAAGLPQSESAGLALALARALAHEGTLWVRGRPGGGKNEDAGDSGVAFLLCLPAAPAERAEDVRSRDGRDRPGRHVR
ncbi:hypothetical protein Skr01_13380 [Sphaerisporangium krabiense]|uniref:histidine kinase n=1 Tax=Sphaerisporangium krabiense TaxID=763782 RepID=A0A7W8ZC12_9ACTN|nr:HAMP domain-containing sensor histidine kinase [Sphaerisporangium krabiense]MBB5631136.1 signal transduction histidine kinase [Sphaerisporangium krabiense]GII61253.1 hypothetical protein Skr01_13380 [Sphaerisporangium krabiense]